MKYRPGCTPVQVMVQLKKALAAVDLAEHCALLWFAEIRRRQLFRQLGYSSMNQFAEVELGFSRTRAGDFLRLAAKLDELPTLRDFMATGKLGYSKAREIIKVATPQTEDRWVELATRQTRAQLRAQVRLVQEKARRRRGAGGTVPGPGAVDSSRGGAPGGPSEGESGEPAGGLAELGRPGNGGGQESLPPAMVQGKFSALVGGEVGHLSRVDLPEVPVRLGVDMAPEQFARFEALMGRLQRLGRHTSGAGRAQVLLDGLAALVAAVEEDAAANHAGRTGTSGATSNSDKKSYKAGARRRAPVQIHVFQCPDCGQAAVRTSRGELPLNPTTFERLACDATIHRPGGAAGQAGACGQAGAGGQAGACGQAGAGGQAEKARQGANAGKVGQANRATIPPKIRAAVLARDRRRCQAPGCRHIHHLEVHHIVPRSSGGSNKMENLITLCSGCHRVWHENGGPPPGWVRAARE